jgi:hypothetical protein
MRKLVVLFTLFILTFSAFVPMAAAQTTESAGCIATDALFDSGLGPYTFGPYSYLAGERITFTFAGVATSSFALAINGTDTGATIVPPTTYEYNVPADGSYTFVVTVTNGTVGNSVSADCLAADEVPTFAPGTICHIPPGNPNAAHTITVGLPAVEAHLAHGDTEGPCPDGVDTRYDNPTLGITIFIIFATGDIQIYGSCDDEGECEEVTNVPITVLINFNTIVVYTDADDDEGDDEGDDGEFVDVENPEDYGFELPDSDPNDGVTVVIYYLHPDPNDSSIGVFQINVYQNGVLVDDNVLLFITADGTIILWTGQDIWDEQFAASLEED